MPFVTSTVSLLVAALFLAGCGSSDHEGRAGQEGHASGSSSSGAGTGGDGSTGPGPGGDADAEDDGADSGSAEPDARGNVDLPARVDAFVAGITRDGGYRGPTAEERRTVAEGLRSTLDGHLGTARERLAGIDWTVRELRDRSTGRRFAELADADEELARERGWGRVYVALGGGAGAQDSAGSESTAGSTGAEDSAGSSGTAGSEGSEGVGASEGAEVGWVVQVPHPVADLHSERLGVGTLLSAPGGVLVLAGAHRDAGPGDSADAAHRTDTVFHAACAVLAARHHPAVQVHGFADDSLPGRDVVVSTGHGHEGARQARRLTGYLESRGLDVCRASRRDCGALEGRENTQGRQADALDVPFLHVEFARSVREDEEGVRDAVGALGELARGWAEREG